MASLQRVVAPQEMREQLGDLLDRVRRGQEHVVVASAGAPVAVLIGADEYTAFRRWLAMRLTEEIGPALAAEADRQALTEDALLELLEEDREIIYRQMYS